MEHLPQTAGKGVLMFARRRQRIDEIAAEHEELRSKGIPVEAFLESEIDVSSKPSPREDVPPVQQNIQIKQHHSHQTQQQIFHQPSPGLNGLDSYQDSSASKSLVSNRTARPFLSGRNQSPAHFSPVRSVHSPTMSKPEHIFKVPVPVNTSPQVWSPTGDIIASRDERIAVPAIKTVILPEMKRRGINKTNANEPPEEDYFSLGAEACNFMQAPSIRQKHPPAVLPKPTINPHCPPWSAEDNATPSPLAPSSPLPVQQHWAPSQPQVATKPWAPSPTQPMPQHHASVHLPTKPSASFKPNWSSDPQQIHTAVSPLPSKLSWTKTPSDRSSVASCPPQRARSYALPSKAPPVASIPEIGSTDGSVVKGKGAELFARRQTRMEKFIVDADTVQANTVRSSSPTLSMPSTWKYSSIVRAPPPVSYNPIVSPFYPLAAQKQTIPAINSNIQPKANKEKPKTPAKHLSVMDVMKHQPYHLDPSLFTYSSNAEAKGSSPKTSPVPPGDPKHNQGSSYLQASSPVLSPGSAQLFQHGAQAKSSGPVSVPYAFPHQSATPEVHLTAPGKLPAPCMMHQTVSSQLTGSNSSLSSSSLLLNSEVSPRYSLPMAPRPKFSAKKAVGGKQWKPVVMLH